MPDPTDLRRSLERAAARFPAERTDPGTLDGRPVVPVRRRAALPVAIATVAALIVAGIIGLAVTAGGAGHHEARRIDVVGGQQLRPAPASTTSSVPSANATPGLSAPPPATSVPATTSPSTVVPTTAPSPTVPRGVVPSTSPTTPPDSPTTCQTTDLTISMAGAQGGLSHVGNRILFTNHGPTCTMQGYPGLDEVENGTTVTSAARTENGYVGGPTNGAQKITLATGDTASALWEGIGGPATSEGPCPSYNTIRITPPGDTVSASLPSGPYETCYPQIHPVVAGPDGGAKAT